MSVIASNHAAPSQLLNKDLSFFHDKRIIVAGAINDNVIDTLATVCQHIQLYCLDFRLYQYYQRRNIPNVALCFSETFSGNKADLLLLYMPKAKEEARYLLANITPYLSSHGAIFVVGENRGGINSAPKLLTPYSTQPKKIDSARRCSLFFAEINKPIAEFDISQWFQTYSITVANKTLQIHSLPGVFSHGRLDKGTALLLETLANSNIRFSGKILDFGCGAGVIASFIAKDNPDVTPQLVDINALAIASSKATLAANNINGDVFPSDVYSDISTTFDAILSNPPFHAGLNTHYSSTETFLEKSCNFLKKGGKLLVVANSFLKYQPFIDKALPQYEILQDNKGFKIYLAHK